MSPAYALNGSCVRSDYSLGGRNFTCICRLSRNIAREGFTSLQHRAVTNVPLGRYFLIIGSVLIGMLFIAERHWPAATSPTFSEARFDKSIIRVESAHKWPERVVFDTNSPTIVPSQTEVIAEAPVIDRRSHEAFAQVSAPQSTVAEVKSGRTRRKSVQSRSVARAAPTTRIAAYRPTEALPAGW